MTPTECKHDWTPWAAYNVLMQIMFRYCRCCKGLELATRQAIAEGKEDNIAMDLLLKAKHSTADDQSQWYVCQPLVPLEYSSWGLLRG